MKYKNGIMFIAFTLIGLLAFSCIGFAKTGRVARTTNRKESGIQRIMHVLQLTPLQKSQIMQIWRSSAMQIRAIRKSPSLSPEQKKEQIIGVRKVMRSEILVNLTPAQRIKLKKIWAGVKVRRGVNILRRIGRALNLTSTQRTAIAGLIKNSIEKARTIRDNTSLSAEQKRDELKANRTELMTQIRGQLTPEQQTKLDSILAKWKKHKA
jgi:Spy/CpxP family protein refolding chaperone